MKRQRKDVPYMKMQKKYAQRRGMSQYVTNDLPNVKIPGIT